MLKIIRNLVLASLLFISIPTLILAVIVGFVWLCAAFPLIKGILILGMLLMMLAVLTMFLKDAFKECYEEVESWFR